MPQITEYIADKGLIVITYSAKVLMSEVKDATVKAIALQSERQTDRVIIDARTMTAWPTLAEMWELVEAYPQLGAPRRTRLAAIRPQIKDETDISGFYETVCQNRCYNAKAFHTWEAAEAWAQSNAND
jgi:hypothetical protein